MGGIPELKKGKPGVKRNLCRCEIYDVCEIYDPNPIPNPNPIPIPTLTLSLSLTLIYDPNPNPIPCEILDACADSPIVINFASGEFRATPGFLLQISQILKKDNKN